MDFDFLFLLGFIWGSLVEYLIHRFLLHNSKFKVKYHLIHHVLSSKFKGLDPDYWTKLLTNEFWAVFVICIIHIPLGFLSFSFISGSIFYSGLYLIFHRLFHTFPNFWKNWMPWHDLHHHFNSSKNFGVITPIWDEIFNTNSYPKLKN